METLYFISCVILSKVSYKYHEYSEIFLKFILFLLFKDFSFFFWVDFARILLSCIN